ncbi:MAG: hypothetical protein ACI3T9_02865 [Romboutsia timonensis]
MKNLAYKVSLDFIVNVEVADDFEITEDMERIMEESVRGLIADRGGEVLSYKGNVENN